MLSKLIAHLTLLRAARPRHLLPLVFLLVVASSAWSQTGTSPQPGNPAVTVEMLEARIAALQSTSETPDDTSEDLVRQYRQAMSNLEEAKANATRTIAFETAVISAPAEMNAVRDQLEVARAALDSGDLPEDPDVTLEELEQVLLKTQAEAAAAVARANDLERKLDAEEGRPAQIRQKLEEGTGQRLDIAAALNRPPEAGETPARTQAVRWILQTRSLVLSSEVSMLNQELRSRPMRLGLLRAQQDQITHEIERTKARESALGDLVQGRRKQELEQARDVAEQTRLRTAGLDPVLSDLAERNAELTEDLNLAADRLDTLRRTQLHTAGLADRITADYQDAEETLSASGLASGLGDVLLESKKYVPSAKAVRRRVRELEQENAQVKVRQLRHREEARRLEDTEATLAHLLGRFTTDLSPEIHAQLVDLVAQRQELLRKVLATDATYLTQLSEELTAERRLADAAETYLDFLNANLLWLGNATPLRPGDLRQLPTEIWALASEQTWTDLAHTAWHGARRAPWFWLGLLSVVLLLWKRRAMISALDDAATLLVKPRSDLFLHTLRAFAWTLGLALPFALLLASVGALLRWSEAGNEPSLAVGLTLMRGSVHLFLLRFWSVACRPSGLAPAHFRWPEPGVKLLRANLRWFTLLVIPFGLLARLAMDLNPAESGSGIITRLCLIAVYAAMGVFIYKVLHPRRGVLATEGDRKEEPLLVRTNRLWFPLILVCPLGLMALTVAGFTYSLSTLSRMFVHSAWLVGGLVILHALALRWLLVMRRRLVFEAAVERRRVAQAAVAETLPEQGADAGDVRVEEPEVDLVALGEDSRELLKLVTATAGLAGLYLIWSQALPALRLFDDLRLWTTTINVEGQVQHLPVTLADVVLALVVILVTTLLARRLPALLEIILLRRSSITAGTRYAATTLFNYVIIVIGAMVALSTVGLKWSQLQWLVAALGVGIGFGLQEIVANFISGLIILFERPVRVGDIVTVGDTDGVVTKIRIRATTIRNWDRKELLVPNKEFITGRLLNWSLSDQMTRIVVVVGAAYGSDVDKALALMKEAATEEEHVLDDPPPVVTFEGFGDNSLTLLLRAYLNSFEYRLPTTTALHQAINRKFAEAGITIAFPQRDVHLDAAKPLRIRLEPGGRDGAGGD